MLKTLELAAKGRAKNEFQIRLNKVYKKLFSHEWYSQEDISLIGNKTIQKNRYDLEQFEVIGSIDQLEIFLKKPREDLALKPIFIIYNKDANHWVTLSITKDKSKNIKVLYKDSFGHDISEDIKDKIKSALDINDDAFLVHTTKEQHDSFSCGPMSLENLKIMAENLEGDKKQKFIEKFKEEKFCSSEEILAKKLEICSFTVKNKLESCSFTEDFKQAFKEFIANLPLDSLVYFSEYQKLMEEFYKNPDQADQEKIKQAKSKILNDEVLNTFNSFRNVDESSNENLLDIEKQFPNEMKKMKEVFNSLEECTDEPEIYSKALDILGTKLDIDVTKLKEFAKLGKDKKDFKNDLRLPEPNIDQISEIVKKNQKENQEENVQGIKEVEQLLAEIASQKPINLPSKDEYQKIYSANEEILHLEASYQKVKLYSKEEKAGSAIFQWDENKIFEWAKSKKGNFCKSEDEICELIAVMDRANELVTGGHHLRDSQILSVLSFLDTKGSNGKICQINTGEGKTTIVSLLSVIKVFQGHKVDVITSNPILAEDGVKEKGILYNLLGLTVSTNNQDDSYKEGPRDCYSADILYGTIGNFQFDYLRDSFKELKTRGDRKFEDSVAILDEMDSILVDNGGHIAKLSIPFPGMESFKYIYIKIWEMLIKAEKNLEKKYHKELEDKAKLLEDKDDTEENKQSEYEKLQQELLLESNEDIKDYIKKTDFTEIYQLIPSHILKYAQDKMDKWIDIAIYAKYSCHPLQQYRIELKDGEYKIEPVDHKNTGAALKNTIWSNGLHQFLQLKHNLHLTFETLPSSFISNIETIKKYGQKDKDGNFDSSKILGVTGTVGSEADQNFVKTICNVNFNKIPTYKKKKFKELKGKIVDDSEWVKEVVEQSLELIKANRAVLIICQTEQDLRDLENELKNNPNLNIRIYSKEEHSDETKIPVKPGDIILATNIAGRGTDFKIDPELEKALGLHVIVGFLPCSKRVEDQAFGRTSRQGNEGTAQLIIRQSEVDELVNKHDKIFKPKESFFTELMVLKESSNTEDLIEKNYGLIKKKMPGDGNCFYHAMLHQFKRNGIEHYKDDSGTHYLTVQSLREIATNHIKNNPEIYRVLIATDGNIGFSSLEKYVEAHSDSEKREWADQVIESALSRALRVNICTLSNIKDMSPVIHMQGSDTNIYLLHSGNHYDSLVPIKDDQKFKELENRVKNTALDDRRHEIVNVGNVSLQKADVQESDSQELIDQDSNSKKLIDIVKEIRDKVEKVEVEEKQENLVPEIHFQDILFQHFSSLAKELKGKNKNKIGYNFILQDLEECWAFWLERKNFKGKDLNEDKAKTEFEQFKEEAKEIIEGTIKHNPYYSISQAELFLSQNMIDEADEALNHAIKLCNDNSDLIGGAYFKLFEVAIEKGGQMLERFKKAIAKVFFINVEKDESYKEKSKDWLKKAKESVEKEIEHIRKNFTKSSEEDLDPEVLKIILGASVPNPDADPKVKENFFLKHIYSRLTCLQNYWNTIDGLISQLEAESINGLAIGKRIPDRLSTLDEKTEDEKKLKAIITKSEISELHFIGLDTMYILKEVHDVPDKVVTRAQAQIGGGIAALATAATLSIICPPASVALTTAGGALISEGVCDIVMELISQGDAEFNEKEYAKAKAISYGITLATMGIGALIQCQKFITSAINACKSISGWLKNSPFMKDLCAKLAKQFDKIEKFLDNTLTKVKFNKLKDATEKLEFLKNQNNEAFKMLGGEQMQNLLIKEIASPISKFQKITTHFGSSMKSAFIEASNDAVMSIFMDKVVTSDLNRLLEDLKPKLKEQVIKEIKSQEELVDKLRTTELEDILKFSSESIEGEIMKDIFTEIALGIVKHSSNWKMKLIALSIDSIITGVKISSCTEIFCIDMLVKLPGGSVQNKVEVDQIIDQLAEQVSNKIYSLIVGLGGKGVVTIPKIFCGAYKDCKYKSEQKKYKQELNKKVEEAKKLLNIDFDASESDINKAFRKKALETHPDKNGNSLEANENFKKLKEARELLIENLKPEKPLAPRHSDQSPTPEAIEDTKSPLGKNLLSKNLLKDGKKVSFDEAVSNISPDKPSNPLNFELEASMAGGVVQVDGDERLVMDWSDKGIPNPSFIKRQPLIGGPIHIPDKNGQFGADLFDHNNSYDRVSEEKNFRVKVKDGHAIPGFRKEDGNIDFDLGKKYEIKGNDQACVARAMIASKKFDELISDPEFNGNRDIAAEKASQFAADPKNIEQHFTDLKKHALNNPKLREKYNNNMIPNNDGDLDHIGGRKKEKAKAPVLDTGKDDENLYLPKGLQGLTFEAAGTNMKAIKSLQNAISRGGEDIEKIKRGIESALTSQDNNSTAPTIFSVDNKGDIKYGAKMHDNGLRVDGKPMIIKDQTNPLNNKNAVKFDIQVNKAGGQTGATIANLFVELPDGKDLTKLVKETGLVKKTYEALQSLGNEMIETKTPCCRVLKFNKNGTFTLSGTEDYSTISNEDEINSFDMKYSLNKIIDILELRLKAFDLNYISIFPAHLLENYGNDLDRVLKMIKDEDQNTSFIPVNLYNKHAVGIMLVKQEDGKLKGYYVDPENKVVPDIISSIMSEQNILVEQLIVEPQRYSNCGPEVIEDFMLYLTGERLDQEDAIMYNSSLVELALVEI